MVEVRLRHDANRLLVVSDNGRGLPEDHESRAAGGLGMKLVKSLVGQVQGELLVSGPPGAVFEIRLATPRAIGLVLIVVRITRRALSAPRNACRLEVSPENLRRRLGLFADEASIGGFVQQMRRDR